MLTGFKNITGIRSLRPEPVVEMNPVKAEELGLTEGEWVYIETSRGRIKQKLFLNNNIDEGVVIVSFGWWFPEETSQMKGWEKSNINILSSSGPDFDPLTGSTQLRGIPCKVYRYEEDVGKQAK